MSLVLDRLSAAPDTTEVADEPMVARQRPTPSMLRELPLFLGVQPATLAWLADRGRLVEYRRGQIVVAQGQRVDTYMFLRSGAAQALHTGPGGGKVLLQRLKRGSDIGGLSLIDGEPASATIRCLCFSELMVFRADDVLTTLKESPVLAENLAQHFVRRLRRVNRRIASLALHDVRDRLVWHLLDMGEKVAEGEWLIRQRINRTELSLMIGASREMVSRAMTAMTVDGTLAEGVDGSMRLRPPAPLVSMAMTAG